MLLFRLVIRVPDLLHRKPAHVRGTDPNEPEHITISYKAKNKDISSSHGGAWHVYTGR